MTKGILPADSTERIFFCKAENVEYIEEHTHHNFEIYLLQEQILKTSDIVCELLTRQKVLAKQVGGEADLPVKWCEALVID